SLATAGAHIRGRGRHSARPCRRATAPQRARVAFVSVAPRGSELREIGAIGSRFVRVFLGYAYPTRPPDRRGSGRLFVVIFTFTIGPGRQWRGVGYDHADAHRPRTNRRRSD